MRQQLLEKAIANAEVYLWEALRQIEGQPSAASATQHLTKGLDILREAASAGRAAK